MFAWSKLVNKAGRTRTGTTSAPAGGQREEDAREGWSQEKKARAKASRIRKHGPARVSSSA